MDVPGYNGVYQVSNNGEIRSLKKKLKYRISDRGYKRVTLSLKGMKCHPYIHVLVAITYIGKIPDGYMVDHVFGDKLCNCDWNLEIVSIGENNRRAYALGLKTSLITKLNQCDFEFIQNNKHIPVRDLVDKFNVSRSSVIKIRNGYTGISR